MRERERERERQGCWGEQMDGWKYVITAFKDSIQVKKHVLPSLLGGKAVKIQLLRRMKTFKRIKEKKEGQKNNCFHFDCILA